MVALPFLTSSHLPFLPVQNKRIFAEPFSGCLSSRVNAPCTSPLSINIVRYHTVPDHIEERQSDFTLVNSLHVGMSPIPLPAPLLDGPPALVEPKKGPVFVLLRLVRVLDTLFFLLAVPADFTRLLRVLELPLRPPLWPRP
jgi:hypothetical protein